jgi:bile acid-coenzyme A ligase
MAEEQRPVSYGRRITDLARRHPDDVALIFARTGGTEQVVVWRELEGRAVSVARLLAESGLGRGDLLVVSLPNSVEHVVATIAGWKLGACVCPLRADLPEWERDRVLEVARAAALAGDWDVGLPSITRRAIAGAAIADGELPDVVAPRAMAVASGGATGTPKLIVTPLPGAAIPGLAAQTSTSGFPAGAGHVQLVPGPLYHTNGFAICQTSLFEDQTVVLMESFDAAHAVDLIERHRVTAVTMAPTMLARLARLPGIDERDLASIQGVMQGAASCPPWLVRRWIDLVGPEHFFIAYGSTERVGLTMIRGDEWLAHPGSVGRGFDTEIRILGADGTDLPAGEVGEIYLRRIAQSRPTYEYVGADPAPQTADGFTSVGDLGWLDAEGYLFVADRRVDMIVTGGANVFPAEVEAALSEHPDVADVAVVGVPDPEWGHRVVAVVEPSAGAHLDTAALDAHARARLAAYKVPRAYEVVDRMPRNAVGKLNRAEIVERFSEAVGEPR